MANLTIQNFNLLINGELIVAENQKYFDAINPSTGEVIARIADASTDDVNRAIAAARRSFDQAC